jgi:hypothetical protein
MDFIFIDGGHSLKTIESDWRYAQVVMDPNAIVNFYDYWNRSDAGCKALIDALDGAKFNVEILLQKSFSKGRWISCDKPREGDEKEYLNSIT